MSQGEIKAFKERPEEFNKPAATIEIYDVPGNNDMTEHGGIGLHIKFFDKNGKQITDDDPSDPTMVHHLAMGAFKAIADMVSEATGHEDNPLSEILEALAESNEGSVSASDLADDIDAKLEELGIDISSIDTGKGNN